MFFLLLVYDYIASAAGAFRMMAAKGACFYYGKSGVGFFFYIMPCRAEIVRTEMPLMLMCSKMLPQMLSQRS